MIFMQSLQRNKQQSIKHRMFYLHHQILKHYSVSNTLYAILIFFQMLQIIYYPIHKTLPDLWPSGVTNVLQDVLHFIEFSGLWELIGEAALLVFLIVMFVLYALNVCFLAYQVLKKDYKTKQPNMIAYKYISYVGVLTKTILFIPTVYACVSFIMASSESFPMTISGTLFGPIAALSIPTLILLFVNTINFCIFLRENNPFSALPFVCSVTQNQQIRTMIKLLMGLYGALIHEQSSIGKVFCIILFVVNVFYLSKIYNSPRVLKFPYDILIQLAPVLTVWISLQSLFQQFIYQGQIIGLLFLGLGVVFVPFVWIELKDRHRSEIMYSNYKFITSPEELLYYNYECLNCVNNLSQVRNLVYLEGILNYHISQCKKAVETCVCFQIRSQMSNYKLEGQKSEIAEEKQLWFRFIKQNLSEIKEKYRNIPQISMLLAYIERDQLNNKFKALHNLEEPSHFNNGLKIEFLNYHYLRQIQERMFNEDRIANQKKTVDVNKFFEFESSFGKLEKGIQQSTVAHLTFWSNLSSQLASKKKIISDGKLIAAKVQETRKLYEKLIEINPSNLHCLIIYANYMKIIVNNPEIYEKSNEVIKVIKRNILNSSKLNNDPQKQKYGDNAVTGVIIISGERSNIGVIKHCNTKITELIKYSPHELLGQNVNILMPKFIGSMHDDILMSYLELTESKFDNNERLAPMIDKDNYLVFVRILTKPLPSLFNGLEMVGIFNLVMESHIDHSGEVPKYVLYRTDSGQVQALSQSCDSEFNYRINKIDQNHQTSSELTFTSLFGGIKDSQLSVVDKSVKSKVRVASQDNDHNEVNVEVYLRHQIYYFGVKLKLLYFFTVKSFKNMTQSEKDTNQQNGVYKKIMVQQEEAEGIKQNEGEKTNEMAKQKKMRELMRKKNNSQYEPMSLKILSRLGYIAHLAFIGVIIFLLVNDLSKNSYLKDFLSFSRISLLSEAQLVEINHFSRLKHLSYYYPKQLPEFDMYSNNITTLGSYLQKNQFSLVQYGLQAKDNKLTYNKNPLSWTINQNNQVSYSATTLDVNVFDYITGASHFQSSQQSSLNFPLQLMSYPSNSTTDYIEFFHLRYTGLYETIPTKNIHYKNSNDYFNSLQSSTLSTNSVQLGAVAAVIVCMLFFYIPLLICLDNFINKTVMLFGYMNSTQIEKQVTNCKVFLEIFFKDSYSVKLSTKRKNIEASKHNSFNTDDVNLNKLRSQNTQNGVFNDKSIEISGEQGEERPRRGSILQSTQKIQALEQQFHNRTQHEIDVSNSGIAPGSQFQEQRQEMLAKVNYEEDESIYEKLQKTSDNSKFKYILIFVLLSGIFIGYFVGRYVVNTKSITQAHDDIQNLKMISQSLNLMKKVKLYGIQSVVDNSQFKNYTLLSTILSTHVSDLYEHQRSYNTYIYPASVRLSVIFGNDRISSLIKESLCSGDNMDLYLTIQPASNIFPKASYTAVQCEQLEDGILKQGLRPALIAFTEILANFTTSNHTTPSMINSSKFSSALKMQKYLEGVQLFYIEKLQTNVNNQIQSFKKLEIILCIVMILIIIFTVLLVWRPMMNNLYAKIVSSAQILGLIPLRIFIKNSKLAKQYEKFISQMVE